MSSTPIFDGLVKEFAERGIRYERLVQPILAPALPRRPRMKMNRTHPTQREEFCQVPLRLRQEDDSSRSTMTWMSPNLYMQSTKDDTISFAAVAPPEAVAESTDELPDYIVVKPLPHKNH